MGVLTALSLETKVVIVAGLIAYVLLKRLLAERGSDVGKLKKAVCISPVHWCNVN